MASGGSFCLRLPKTAQTLKKFAAEVEVVV
jgi:hypothetical protein